MSTVPGNELLTEVEVPNRAGVRSGAVGKAIDTVIRSLVPVLLAFVAGGVLLLILGFVFLLGFSEAVGVAIPLVAVFLVLNAVVTVVGLVDVFRTPDALANWTTALTAHGSGFLDLVGPSVLAFLIRPEDADAPSSASLDLLDSTVRDMGISWDISALDVDRRGASIQLVTPDQEGGPVPAGGTLP